MQKGIFVMLIIIALLLVLNLFTQRYIGITPGTETSTSAGCYILNTWTGKVWGTYGTNHVRTDWLKPVIKEKHIPQEGVRLDEIPN